MLKNLVSVLGKHIVMLVMGVVLGVLALLAVHLLPTEPMVENVQWSLEMIEKEFDDEWLITGYQTTMTGNFTDCLMLEHAIYSNEAHTILEQALQMYRAETYDNEMDPEGWWPGYSLKDYVEGVEQPREVSYSRYWHGYLVVLKPLLLLTTFNNIRLINAAFQLILVGMVMIALGKKNAHSLAGAFLVSLPFMFFFSTFSSLSLSVCFYIMHISVLIQCKWGEQFEQKSIYAMFFFVIGMITAYFDFLTYPLITLGYPLCIYLYFNGSGLKQDIKKMLTYSVEWGIGYGGMWASKWLVTDALIGSATIQNALENAALKVQSAGNESRISGFGQVIVKCAGAYANWCFLIIGLAVMLVLVVKMRKCGLNLVRKNLQKAIVFIAVSVFPFAWWFVMQSHSEGHWQFTCRIFSLTVFACVTGMLKLCEGEESKSENVTSL